MSRLSNHLCHVCFRGGKSYELQWRRGEEIGLSPDKIYVEHINNKVCKKNLKKTKGVENEKNNYQGARAGGGYKPSSKGGR